MIWAIGKVYLFIIERGSGLSRLGGHMCTI